MWLDTESDPSVAAADMTDVVLRISCAALPVDHAYQLSRAICGVLPWVGQIPNAGVHPIYVAGSQNGWARPEADSDGLLMLSKRTRLRIRVPISHASQLIADLNATTLNVAGHRMQILSGQQQAIIPTTTLFSRYTWYGDSPTDMNEAQFVTRVAEQCNEIGFSAKKILCGRSHHVACDNGYLLTRSVLLADIPVEHSTKLLDSGLGERRLMGCGLLIPHKDTAAVR